MPKIDFMMLSIGITGSRLQMTVNCRESRLQKYKNCLIFVSCSNLGEMKRRLSNILKYSLSVAVAAFLLYFSFRGIKWEDFMSGLRNCSWGYIVLSMAIGIAVFWIRGLRWRELLLPTDGTTTRLTTFNATNIGYLVNLALPRVGELVRCGYITKNSARDGEGNKLASYDKVLGTVVIERSWDVVCMGLCVLLFLIFKFDRFGAFFKEKVFQPFAEGLSANLLWILAALLVLFVVSVWLLFRFRKRNRLCDRIFGFVAGVFQGIGSCLKMKGAWRFFLYTLLIWFGYWLMSASVLFAVQGMKPDTLSPELANAVGLLSGLDMTDALFLMLAGSVSSLVPVPGGFGAFHTIVALALSTYGIPFSLGIVFAILSHESQAVTMIICGGISYISETLRK